MTPKNSNGILILGYEVGLHYQSLTPMDGRVGLTDKLQERVAHLLYPAEISDEKVEELHTSTGGNGSPGTAVGGPALLSETYDQELLELAPEGSEVHRLLQEKRREAQVECEEERARKSSPLAPHPAAPAANMGLFSNNPAALEEWHTSDCLCVDIPEAKGKQF